MSASRLLKQLRREIVSSPKKAAVLGAMALTGLYFWAPLLTGWLGSSTAKPAKTVDPNAEFMQVLATGVATPAPKPAEATKQQYSWSQLIGWMDNDARHRPATIGQQQRDPFHDVRTEAEKTVEKPVVVEKPVSPESLGLALSSTVIGPKRRVAVINGKSYTEGDTVTVTADGKEVRLRLMEVRPQQASVEYNATLLQLKIAAPKLSGRIELVENKN